MMDNRWLRNMHRIPVRNSGITSRRNQFLQFRNSWKFLPIPTHSASIQFRNSVVELLSAFTLTIDYVYGYRLTSAINEWFRYGIPELHSDGISSRNLGIPGNSFQFAPIPLLFNSGIPEENLTHVSDWSTTFHPCKLEFRNCTELYGIVRNCTELYGIRELDGTGSRMFKIAE